MIDHFLAALAKNEDDTGLRMVYADYLDELGEHEEAERQRAWPAAKAWLVAFAAKHTVNNYDVRLETGIQRDPMTYKHLMEVCNLWDENRPMFPVHDSDDALDALEDETLAKELWRNWSIVTGKPGPIHRIDLNPFVCCY